MSGRGPWKREPPVMDGDPAWGAATIKYHVNYKVGGTLTLGRIHDAVQREGNGQGGD